MKTETEVGLKHSRGRSAGTGGQPAQGEGTPFVFYRVFKKNAKAFCDSDLEKWQLRREKKAGAP